MKQEIVANCMNDETRIAVIEDGKLVELGIERQESEKVIGNIYKGKVENVLPGISSAFVNIGLEKNAYLYITDVIDQSELNSKEHGKRSHHHGGGSQNKAIDQSLKRGDVFMVQVAKEAIGMKGVKITMDISLPGRFLVYLPFQTTIGVSKNIEEESERHRLKRLLDSMRPKTGGFIVRTEAEEITEQEMRREVRYLSRLWENIQKRFQNAATPSLVHKDLGLVFQTVRDVLSEDTVSFIIDNKTEHQEAQEFVQMISPDLADRVRVYEGKLPIFEEYNVEKELETLLRSRIGLPSGGTIVIQEAESLCAIDVNTGKFTGKESQEETVTETNIEAANEIARQIRLRNIGGIVVIDFIDMRRARNRQKVVEALHLATANDRAKIKILPITRLGLVEMTRERKRESMLAALCQPCEECHGMGMVLSNESLFIQVKKEMSNLLAQRNSGTVRLILHPDVAPYFQERRSEMVNAIHRDYEQSTDATFHYEDYKIIVE